MTEIQKPTEEQLVKNMIEHLRNSGHYHEFNGRKDVIGNKECYLCLPVIQLADAMEKVAKIRTFINGINPKIQPCEICGEEHQNYNCCEQCNYDNHRCHFCGDDLGHSQTSVCYLTDSTIDEKEVI